MIAPTNNEKLAEAQRVLAEAQAKIKALGLNLALELPEDGTTGFTVKVRTEKLVAFKDAAIDERKHFYVAFDEAVDLWMAEHRKRQSRRAS